MLKLRPYQEEALEAIESHQANGTLKQVVHLPTAAGKTLIFASLISKVLKLDPTKRVLILAFSCDLLQQGKDKIVMIDPSLSEDIGIVDAVRKEFHKKIVISSVQSARQPSVLDNLRAQGFSICIADECHHFACDSAKLVLNELGFGKDIQKDKLLVGFSATPFRQDSKGLAEVFDKIIYTKTTKEMINEGYLCKPVGSRVVTDLDLSQVTIHDGDYSTLSLAKVMNTPTMNNTVVSSYLEGASGRKTIAFATSIAHATALAECFNQHGVSAASIHSDLHQEERESLKKRFKDGEIEVLTNPLMLTEGYDESSISCVIVARPTQNPGLYQQMVGRGLRLHPNKHDCLILDFSDHNHTLCSIGILLNDPEGLEGDISDSLKKEKAKELIKTLPPNLNPKLKKAIVEMDLLGDSFTWKKDQDGNYCLKGTGDIVLKILKVGEDRYEVIFSKSGGVTVVASGVDFGYGFASAEGFAKENREKFVVSDLDASWRGLPISEKQKEIFHSSGFKSGIDELSRGQASTLIASGFLRRRRSKSMSRR